MNRRWDAKEGLSGQFVGGAVGKEGMGFLTPRYHHRGKGVGDQKFLLNTWSVGEGGNGSDGNERGPHREGEATSA